MTQTRIYSITALASVALIGLILIQVNWLYGAFQVIKEDFDQRVQTALLGVYQAIDPGDELYIRINTLTDKNASSAITDTTYLAETLALLDDKMRSGLHRTGVTNSYHFALYLIDDPNTYFASHPMGRLSFDYKVELTRNCVDCGLYLGLTFPQVNIYYYLRQISGLLLISLILVALVIVCFGYTIISLQRQQKLSAMKTAFINNMTHEYKTPLFTISVATKVLQEAPEVQASPQLTEHVSLVDRATQRLKQHTERILDLARLESRQTSLELRPTDVHALIQEVAQTVGVLFEKDGGSLTLDLNAQSAMVQADATQLTQVLYNLLDNAQKYSVTPPRATVCTSDGASELVVKIQDQGIGISKKQQAHIFDTFYRVPTGDQHDVKGFGLGLSYVKQVVEAHGGTITVDSQVGEGTCFEIRLPQ